MAVVALPASTLARAADPQLGDDILPLLKSRCVKCHGPAKQEGKLNLGVPVGLARGGESGGLLVPGDPAASLLWQRIEADEMPPDDPLPPQEKAAIKKWIASGAAGLPSLKPGQRPASDHWAFDRLKSPEPPTVAESSASLSPIDRFLLARLESHGLTPNAEADRATLNPPRELRPDRPAADSGRNRRFRARPIRRGISGHGRTLPGIAPLW